MSLLFSKTSFATVPLFAAICVSISFTTGCNQGGSKGEKVAAETTTQVATVDDSRPLYCKIAIGPAKEKICLLKVDLVKMLLQYDLNGDGNLNDTGETFPIFEKTKVVNTRYFSANVPDEIRQGDDVHTGLTVTLAMTGKKIKASINMLLWGRENSNTDANLVPLYLSSDAESAPLIHFNGPLTMGRYRKETKLKIGSESDFYSFVGTKGIGEGSFTAIENTTIPTDLSPVAEFTFPHRDKTQPPLKLKTKLEVRC